MHLRGTSPLPRRGCVSQERVWAAPHVLCYMHACRPPSALQREQKINTQPTGYMSPQIRGALTAPLRDATPRGRSETLPLHICRVSLSHTTPQFHHPTIRKLPYHPPNVPHAIRVINMPAGTSTEACQCSTAVKEPPAVSHQILSTEATVLQLRR